MKVRASLDVKHAFLIVTLFFSNSVLIIYLFSFSPVEAERNLETDISESRRQESSYSLPLAKRGPLLSAWLRSSRLEQAKVKEMIEEPRVGGE